MQHGKIYIHDNSNLDLIFKITQNFIIKVTEKRNKAFGSTATSLILSKSSNEDNNEENEFENINNRQSPLYEKKKSKYQKARRILQYII